jgi:DNA polymerase-3 subunit gamma/tau
MLGSVDRSHVFTLIGALAQGDGRAVLQTIDQLRVHGLSAMGLLDDMSGVLQRMAVEQMVPGGLSSPSADSAGDPDVARTVALAQAMPADETQLLYSLCLQGKQELGLAPDEYAGLTMVLLRLLAFKPAGLGDGAEKKSLKPAPALPTEPGATQQAATESGAPEAASAAASVQAAGPAVPVPSADLNSKNRASNQYSKSAEAYISPEVFHAAPPPYVASSVEPAGALVAEGVAGAVLPFARVPPVAAAVHLAPVAPGLLRMPVRGEAGTSPLDQPKPLMPTITAQAHDGVGLGDDVGVREGAPPARTLAPEGSDDGGFWLETVSALIARELIAALVRELALQSQLVARDTDSQPPRWLLRVERESLTQMSTRERLQAALAQLGHEVHLDLEGGVVSDSPARRLQAAAARRQRAAERLVQTDGYVQQLQSQWGARVVSGSIKPLA